MVQFPKKNDRKNFLKWSKATCLALFISFFSLQYLLEFAAIYCLPGIEEQLEGEVLAIGGPAVKDPNYKIKIQFSNGNTKLWQNG